jgi:hypothetical protein
VFSVDRACALLAALQPTENYLSFRGLQLTNFNLFETFGFARRSRIYFTDSSSVDLPGEGAHGKLQNCSRYQTVVTANCLTERVNVYTDIIFFFCTFPLYNFLMKQDVSETGCASVFRQRRHLLC